MCGRTSCYCQPETYRSATGYFDPESGKYVRPDWKDVDGHEFKSSTNVAPTDFTPVLIPGSIWEDVKTDRALQPMMWGMIPPWHQGDYKTHGLSTNNCRIENIRKSKLYSPSLKGKRCVIICDGFYEWMSTKGSKKQPYFVYSPQPEGIKAEEIASWENGTWCEEKGWIGPNILKMAGLFNEWHSPSDEVMFSYTVITMEANKTLNWLHHRMPAILSNEEQVLGWLDVEGTEVVDALELLTPVEKISYHPVSTIVNNSRNKDTSCNKPFDIKNVDNKSSSFMQAWLGKGKKESSTSSSESTPNKKIKLG
ncbi:embryonic stem cell-specific 5-hydroxymethylcytosine-binding protein [Cimex lectularius]|uniref:Abasic site processing protein HMCES n=1 Tax=Cimex lectularius TaxID=79782 RepID=A0A8I6SQ26_CIMLE|nr:embryonic stem cell-specific 5-hydroxymethylcytosine-binding protein [Cimex lectularius]